VLAKPSPQLASVHPLPRPAESARRHTDEAALARAAMEGESAAATLLWSRFSQLVRGLLRRSLGPQRDVEDHVQEVFLRFFGQLRRLRDPAAVRSFLVGITVRVSRSELRRRRIRRWLSLTDDGELPDAPAPARDEAAREALARLYRVLDGVDDEGRLAFVLRHIEGLELTEVAAALGISLATTKRRLARVTARVFAQVERDPILVTYLIQSPRESDERG
jgi:RNA polymerase sigma-70 factor (ECF subfamily)